MAVVVLDKRLLDLVDEDVKVEQIASGCTFTEGPLWHPANKTLHFSDVRTAKMHIWSEKDGARVFRDPSGGSNGNTWDKDGNLVTCEHNNRRVSRTRADGSIETVADSYRGAKLNSPNDVIRTRNGDLIFTDPTYGLRNSEGQIVGQEYPFAGVFRWSSATGELTALAEDFPAPNGLAITDDERTLYVVDSREQSLYAFDVAADGSVSNKRLFCKVSHGETDNALPDGIKLDSRGNVWVTANRPVGVWVYAPDGTLLGQVGVGESPANCAWGGDDWQTLFVTAATSVYRFRAKVAGQKSWPL